MDRRPYRTPDGGADEFADAAHDRSTPAEGRDARTYTHIPSGFLALIGGSLAWFVGVGWLAYATGIDGAFAMLIASVFAVVAIGLPALLVAVGRSRRDRAGSVHARLWLRGRFETWTGRIRSREALVQVLLPISATAVGFTLIAIVLASVRLGAISPN
jgi:hypothetical protein